MSNSKSSSPRQRALIAKDKCPMALAAQLLGDKWTLLVLREAFYGVQRYDDMLQDLGAPRATLTNRLTKLVAAGILNKQAYQETGDRERFGYQLTDAGRDLANTLIALTEWGETHLLKSKAPVMIVDQNTGQKLRLALVTRSNEIVDARHARLTTRK